MLKKLGASLKSLVKIVLQSRPSSIAPAPEAPAKPIIIMGNGPSLREVIDNNSATLRRLPSLAVNFAANAPEFTTLRPDYYLMADPVFFHDLGNANVGRLWEALAKVDWPMRLFIPAREKLPAGTALPQCVKVERFNFIGLDGFRWLRHAAYRAGLGMPRPRNVLIPAIMAALAMGYREIYLVGADHTWTKTLSVTDDNTVVSIQPHFYADNADEAARVASVYKDIRLHQLMYSFYVAFSSYFTLADYAASRGASIINATKGSFIDAFPRAPLPEIGESAEKE